MKDQRNHYYWTNPNNDNVSFTDTDNPYQYNLPGNGFSRLQFTSFTTQHSGLYSCISGQQINSIYISNGKYNNNSITIIIVVITCYHVHVYDVCGTCQL